MTTSTTKKPAHKKPAAKKATPEKTARLEKIKAAATVADPSSTSQLAPTPAPVETVAPNGDPEPAHHVKLSSSEKVTILREALTAMTHPDMCPCSPCAGRRHALEVTA